MTKNLTVLLVALGLHLFITACDASHDPHDQVSEIKTLEAQKICYSLDCANTTPSSDITNAGKDYVYPDNRKFPDASLRAQYRAPIAFLDLLGQSVRIKVSKDFMLSEFVQPEKGRYGILLPIAVKSAQAIRDALGGPVKITSGYRSPGYNSRTDGSATWSRHTYGDAMDMQFKNLKSLEQECTRKNASFVLAYTAHIHCDWRKVALDPAFYPPAKDVSPAFAQLRHNYSAKMQIVQNSGTLSVTLPEDLELEGIPLYRWKVTTPKNDILYFETPTVTLPNFETGNYLVEVVVGETLHTTWAGLISPEQ